MSLFDFVSTDTLGLIAAITLPLGLAMLVAPFLGIGAKRTDPYLAAMLRQVSDAPARETYIGEIVDAPEPARARI